MKCIANFLRRLADRMDPKGAPKLTGYSFTFEEGTGIVFHDDVRGCRIAYLGDDEYEWAHIGSQDSKIDLSRCSRR